MAGDLVVPAHAAVEAGWHVVEGLTYALSALLLVGGVGLIAKGRLERRRRRDGGNREVGRPRRPPA